MDDAELERRRDFAKLEEQLSPILPPAKTVTETTVTIRLPVEFKQTLKAAAEARGLNLSDYLRAKLSNETIPLRRRSRPQLTSVDRSLLVELNRIGVNLNQLVKQFNRRDNLSITATDRRVLAQLNETFQQIRRSLTESTEAEEKP